MRPSILVLASFSVLLHACAATETEAPRSAARPGPAPAARRVVLLSLDGFAAGRHQENLRHGVYSDPDGVASFGGGYTVDRAIPVNPTLTAVSHTSIATGALPSATGIVSNVFHVPGAGFGQVVSGFDAPWGADSLWSAFRRQGKRVGVLTFPGCDATTASRTADFGMTYVNASLARPRVLTFDASRFTTVALPSGWSSYSPARRATFSVDLSGQGLPASAAFTLTALDTTDDGRTDYDTLVVDDDADLANGVLARAHAGEWFPLRLQGLHPDGGTRTVGAWCLLQALPPDLGAVKVYRGGFYATEAYPREFREALERSVGFWPGPPDERALERSEAGEDGISTAEMLAQVRRFSEFFSACARTAIDREPFDLLMLYQPIVDEVEHQLLLVDPRQRDFSPARASAARAAVTETFRAADAAVGDLARALDLTSDALVVVADHGMAPVWEDVHVNQLLQHAGLAAAVKVENRWRAAPTSRIVAVTSGGCAHLYVNLKGREPGGIVEPAEEGAVVQAAAVALARAQVDGQDIVEAMYTRSELAKVGLDSPNSGDLVAFLHPGFAASAEIGASGAPWHMPASYCGQHGFLNSHPEIAAIWMARGAAVPHRHVEQESLTEVAAFVARLAGVTPPLQARPWSP